MFTTFLNQRRKSDQGTFASVKLSKAFLIRAFIQVIYSKGLKKPSRVLKEN